MTNDHKIQPSPPAGTVGMQSFQDRITLRRRVGKWAVAGAIAVMLVAMVLAIFSGDSLVYQDEKDYNNLAYSLLHEHRFAYPDGTLTAFRAPGYPFLLAATYTVLDRPLAAKLVNGLVLGLSAFLLALIARRIYPGSEVFVPFLIIAYPLILYESILLYPQTLGGLMLGLIVLLISREPLSIARAMVSGIVYGLLILVIPAFVPIAPVFALFFFVIYRKSFAQFLGRSSAFFLIAALVVAPWTFRNQLVFGTFVPVSSNGGVNLFVGNSALSTADSGLNDAVLALCKTASKHMDEITADRAFKQCAIDWITTNPYAAARLYVAKVANYFNYENQLTTSNQGAQWKFWLVFATYYPILIAALIRALLAKRIPLTRDESLIYMIYFGNAFLSAIFFTRLRFRIPFDYLLIAIEAAFFARCLTMLRNRAPRTS